MADTVVATDQPVPQTGRPAEDLAAAFENFRTSLLAHPALVPVVARRPPGDEATRQTPTGCSLCWPASAWTPPRRRAPRLRRRADQLPAHVLDATGCVTHSVASSHAAAFIAF